MCTINYDGVFPARSTIEIETGRETPVQTTTNRSLLKFSFKGNSAATEGLFEDQELQVSYFAFRVINEPAVASELCEFDTAAYVNRGGYTMH